MTDILTALSALGAFVFAALKDYLEPAGGQRGVIAARRLSDARQERQQ